MIFLFHYDEDWDVDLDDDVSEANQGGLSAEGTQQAAKKYNNDVGSALDVNMARKMGDSKGTVCKNLNRFSHFVKTGGEDYYIIKKKSKWSSHY